MLGSCSHRAPEAASLGQHGAMAAMQKDKGAKQTQGQILTSLFTSLSLFPAINENISHIVGKNESYLHDRKAHVE